MDKSIQHSKSIHELRDRIHSKLQIKFQTQLLERLGTDSIFHDAVENLRSRFPINAQEGAPSTR